MIKRFNKFEVIEDGKTIKIQLASKKHGIMYGYCDIEDWEKLKNYKWNVYKAYDNPFYIKAYVKVGNEKGTMKYFHRVILNPEKGVVVNHKDHDGLNNRKTNLEICTNKENVRYQRKHKDNTSGYKGVTWDKRCKKWESKIGFNRKIIHLGLFDNILDAVKAYNDAALKYHGEFAFLNEMSILNDPPS